MSPHLSRHVDDQRYWRFERTSGLPRGYFDKPRRFALADVLVIAIPAIGLALALIFQW